MISTSVDEFIRNKIEGEAYWVVTLNNGLVVYQDDYRPNIEPWNSWLRLRDYCYAEGVYPVKMHIRFRSHVEHMPENAEGYYFVRSVLASFGSDITQHLFVIGTIDGGLLQVNKWKTPELIVVDSEYRKFKEHDLCLISKNLSLRQQENSVLLPN